MKIEISLRQTSHGQWRAECAAGAPPELHSAISVSPSQAAIWALERARFALDAAAPGKDSATRHPCEQAALVKTPHVRRAPPRPHPHRAPIGGAGLGRVDS